uniref:N-acetyltransferase ESCO2-like n=1 Tax=Crassostrea virginica TaxID=6565 RepID=A0A8B8CHB5_CRAVI|nr:N-acetyltransferase ESCO2-like [Crassostrea virginica]
MATRMKSLRKRKNCNPEDKSHNEYDFNEVENTPPKKKRLANKPSVSDIGDSTLTSQSDSENVEDTIAVKSFYGKREKKSFPHSPKRRRVVKQVLKKLSDEENLAQEESQSSESEPERKNKEKVLPPRTKKGPSTPPVQQNNSRTSSPRTPKVQTKTDSPITPGTGEKRFFKHRCPGSAEKYIPGVIIRKGFDIKFTPNRKDIVLGKQKSGNDKIKSKKSSWPLTPFPKNKIKKTGLTVKDNIRHSFPLSTTRSSLSQEGSPVVSTVQSESTDKTWSPNSTASAQSIVDSIHSGPSVRDRGGNQPSEPVCPPEEDVSSSSTTEDKASLITEDISSIGDTVSDVMEGIQPLETVVSSHEGTPQKTDAPQEDTKSSESPESSSTASSQQKFFPIFDKVTPSPNSRLRTLRNLKSRSASNSPKLRFIENKDDQMTLDAGQKKFGATQCETCGMVYSQAEPTDETTHAKFHQSILNALKFPGWKKERVVQEYDDGSRVIMVMYEDPKYAHKKVEEINRIIGTELGFPETAVIFRTDLKVYLMISEEKKIIGCCFAENITQGHRVLADSQSSQESGSRPWYCDTEPEPASVGISKIWVHKLHRRMGVARKLLDCVRQNFHFGTYISKKRVAFSDPTPDGKRLATEYTGTSSFLVYKYG